MTAHEHTSPEEKLLNLIRKKDPSARSSGSQSLSFDKNFLKIFENKQTFESLNKILTLAAVVLGLYIGYQILFMQKNINSFLNNSKNSTSSFEKIVIKEPQPYTYYVAPSQARDLFDSQLFGKKTIDTTSSNNTPVSQISELSRTLKLVGIVLDKQPEAIIEDIESRQTFFLHKGESVRGAVLDHIEEGRIILLYQDQKVELVQ